MASIIFGGPTAHPTRHPVRFNSLDALPMVTVLSRMSPIVAKRTCSSAGSNTERSYTSSEMTNRSFSSAIAAMPSSSFLDKTCPLGLCGEQLTMAHVRPETHARRIASTSTTNPSSALALITTHVAPTSSAMALYQGKNGSTKTNSRAPSGAARIAA